MGLQHGHGVLAAAKNQLRLALPLSILPATIFVLLCPLVVSIRNLDMVAASMVLERVFALAGILLLTPLLQPESDAALREVVAGKQVYFIAVWGLRLVLVTLLLPLFTLGFVGVMRAGGSVFPFGAFVFGGFATAFLLGALGFFAAAASGNWVIGYLAPVLYLSLAFGLGPGMGLFYPFSLAFGGMREKVFLVYLALLLCAAGLMWRAVRARVKGAVA